MDWLSPTDFETPGRAAAPAVPGAKAAPAIIAPATARNLKRILDLVFVPGEFFYGTHVP
jgi:hypothetical protein